MTLLVGEYGSPQPQPIGVQGFAEAGRFDGFEIPCRRCPGMLKGSRLDEVASLSIKSVVFTPGELSSRRAIDELPMVAQDAAAAGELKPRCRVSPSYAEGWTHSRARTRASMRRARKAVLIGKSVQPSALGSDSNIQLADSGELPLDATLVFSIRAQAPASFARDETVDVATADESMVASLEPRQRHARAREFAGGGGDPQAAEGVRRLLLRAAQVRVNARVPRAIGSPSRRSCACPRSRRSSVLRPPRWRASCRAPICT